MCIVLATIFAAAIDPKYATNITVFHVNEHKFGAIPVNMNTGDAVGDLFFDMLEVLITPLTCANRSGRPSHGPDPCTNPEAVGDDLMINKVTLEVDRRFSGYGACNVCINGTDPLGEPCATGTYHCDCFASSRHWPPLKVPCNATVGFEDVFKQFSRFIKPGCRRTLFKPQPTPADCYRGNFFSKLSADEHGSWYSSLDKGDCAKAGSACTWRVVSVDKIVKRSCHTRVFGEVVPEPEA